MLTILVIMGNYLLHLHITMLHSISGRQGHENGFVETTLFIGRIFPHLTKPTQPGILFTPPNNDLSTL